MSTQEREKTQDPYLKNSYPSIANIIKINSSVVRVEIPRLADIVILVPVYAGVPVAEIQRVRIGVVGVHAQSTFHLILLPVGDVRTPLHAVVPVG